MGKQVQVGEEGSRDCLRGLSSMWNGSVCLWGQLGIYACM
jgi:hypothetical protein